MWKWWSGDLQAGVLDSKAWALDHEINHSGDIHC